MSVNKRPDTVFPSCLLSFWSLPVYVDKIVEKIVEVPVDKIVEKQVEKIGAY